MDPSLTTLVKLYQHLDHTSCKKYNFEHQETLSRQKGVFTLGLLRSSPPSLRKQKAERMNERHVFLGNSFSTLKTKINQRQKRNRRLVMLTLVTFGIAGSLVCYISY